MNFIPPSKIALDNYTAALYLRLSKDDPYQRESDSIANQRQILTEYAAENGISVYDEYVDDGHTGTNFERPSFQRMLEDARTGKVNMVIVKDLSRLGREYIDTGQYLERIFPRLGVRFISIGDNFDSLYDDEPSADMIPMVNFFNEFHAKQTSRKVRATKTNLARNGKYIGSRPPFGYIRDPADKYHLVVDEEAAETVRLIFQLACDGLGYKAIARQMREQGLLNPNAYALERNPDVHKSDYWKQPHDWHATSIKTILHNHLYLGKLVSGKRGVSSFKNKQIIYRPEESWIVVEGTHEPIVTQKIWDRAHEKLAVRKRCDNHGAMQIFAGLVKCADCGYALAFSKSDGNGRYQCSQYNVKGKAYCSSHHITYEELYKAVLFDIRRRAKAAASMDERILLELRKDAAGLLKKKLKAAEKVFRQVDGRIAELDTIISRMYEDGALGRINPERASKMMETYEAEQAGLKEQRDVAERELLEQQKRQSESDEFIRLISQYRDITKLNAIILNELISKIEVGAIQRFDGVKHRKISITYRQFCYVEIFTHDEVFGNWDGTMYDEWREVDAALDARDATETARLQEHIEELAIELGPPANTKPSKTAKQQNTG